MPRALPGQWTRSGPACPQLPPQHVPGTERGGWTFRHCSSEDAWTHGSDPEPPVSSSGGKAGTVLCRLRSAGSLSASVIEMTSEQSPKSLLTGADLWAAGSHPRVVFLFMQYIPAGNFQSRWWGYPGETGWVYQRAAASDSTGSASEQSEQRNSIQMEQEGGFQNWSCWRSQQILPRSPAASSGQELRGWPWKMSLNGTARPGDLALWPQEQRFGGGDFQGSIKLIRNRKDQIGHRHNVVTFSTQSSGL